MEAEMLEARQSEEEEVAAGSRGLAATAKIGSD